MVIIKSIMGKPSFFIMDSKVLMKFYYITIILKFGQLTEHNMRNMFLKNSYTKCGGKFFHFLSNFYLRLNGLRYFSITKFNIQILCNILDLEKNFGNLY